jgi:hypothetical protein
MCSMLVDLADRCAVVSHRQEPGSRERHGSGIGCRAITMRGGGMGEVERYPNGTFCWVDLGTNDAAGAKAFYGGLLGWEFDDQPTGEQGTYSICRLKGRAVAGLYDRQGARAGG